MHNCKGFFLNLSFILYNVLSMKIHFKYIFAEIIVLSNLILLFRIFKALKNALKQIVLVKICRH